MAEINTPIEQLSFEERALNSPRGSTVGTMTQWNEQMKHYIATGKFTLFCAKWTMTSKRSAFETKSRTRSAVLGSLRQAAAVNTIS
jgi:hypothetical protein